MAVPNINNPKEKAPSNAAEGPQGMISKEAIRMSSEKAITLTAPVIVLNADSIVLNGNVAVTGSLTVNGVSVP